MITPSPLDMASLYGCRTWLGGQANATSDDNLQACLTAASFYFLRYTGRGPRNWQNTTQNPFNETVDYAETYDGIAGQKLFLRNSPINSVSSLTVGGLSVSNSSSTTSPGYTVDDQGRAVVIRLGGAGQGYGFARGYAGPFRGGNTGRPFASGVQSIQVSYNAGYTPVVVDGELYDVTEAWVASTAVQTGDVVSDGVWLQQAQNSGTTGALKPAFSQSPQGTCTDGPSDPQITWLNLGQRAAPYTVVIQNDTTTLSDQGVKLFSDGTVFNKVTIAPQPGEYYLVAPGVYLFNAANAGNEVAISYTAAGTPADIVQAIFQMVALNYLRRNWIGTLQVAMKDVGSTTYTMQLDQNIRDVLEFYRRASFNS